jgi:uncharacterized membrane protein YcaP (DUF421 family)
MNLWIVIIIMLPIGFLVMRLAGRKSLSEMTISQAVMMIAVGSLLIEPIKDRAGGKVFITVLALFLFIIILYALEWLALKNKTFEKWWIGCPKVLISEGQIDYVTLKKVRISETMLQSLLRENGVQHVSDCRTVTIEPNGAVGVDKYSKEDISETSPNLFKEVKNEKG